jgi:hypothetical protein
MDDGTGLAGQRLRLVLSDSHLVDKPPTSGGGAAWINPVALQEPGFDRYRRPSSIPSDRSLATLTFEQNIAFGRFMAG